MWAGLRSSVAPSGGARPSRDFSRPPLAGVSSGPPPPAGREPLVVAGPLPLGVGLLIGLPRPHDGWIRVSETHVDGARVILSRAWHFGMLFSRRVADSLEK